LGIVRKNIGVLVCTLNFGVAQKNVVVLVCTLNFGIVWKKVGVWVRVWKNVDVWVHVLNFGATWKNVGVQVRVLNLALHSVHTHNKMHAVFNNGCLHYYLHVYFCGFILCVVITVFIVMGISCICCRRMFTIISV
jgi:hypothetical protein